jgi:hypothetical protein
MELVGLQKMGGCSDECASWYSDADGSFCDENGSVNDLSLSYNNLVGTIPNELALLSNLSKSSIVWLLVLMIVLSCVFFIVLSCLLVIFHSTARLDLSFDGHHDSKSDCLDVDEFV